MQKKCFKPIINHATKVLVLGSMPGEKSLAENQYYAFKHNKFWTIINELTGVDSTLDYTIRCKKLLGAGIGLWDVISTCTRAGSLDSAIKQAEPNDFKTLIENYSSLRAICFNGQKSFSIFAKYFISKRSELYLPELENIALHKLPSTSPAHASISYDDKLTSWSVIKRYII